MPATDPTAAKVRDLIRTHRLTDDRRKPRITQAELAGLCRVSQATVSDWESGSYAPSLANFVLLVKYLGLGKDDLHRFFTDASNAVENAHLRREAAA